MAAIGPLLDDPAGAAVLSDLDGTLAPIVARPELARVPDQARVALARIADRFAVAAVVSGRRATVAREIVGLDEARPTSATTDSSCWRRTRPSRGPRRSSVRHGRDAARFAAGFDAAELDAAGLRVEDKGPIVALHWRGAADESGAEALAERIAAEAEGAGLVIHRGRKVLELRPSGEVDKGTAIESLLLGSAATAALYAGDDRTDLDGFSALDRLAASGRLRTAVRIGVASAEGPAEITARADLTVDGPAGLVPVLAALAS